MSDDANLRGPSVRGIPEGDNRERMICAECGYILYDNPKIVVGSVARWGDRILLCRRSIQPRYGFWTLPAGYLELNESASAGAEREAWEEARARIEIEGLLAIYDIPRISQVQLMYRARLLDDDESLGRLEALGDEQAVLGLQAPAQVDVGQPDIVRETRIARVGDLDQAGHPGGHLTSLADPAGCVRPRRLFVPGHHTNPYIRKTRHDHEATAPSAAKRANSARARPALG